MKNNRGRVLLGIAMIISILYIAYSFYYWGGLAAASSSDSEAIGTGIATMLVMPHLLCTGIGLLMNILAFFMRSRGFALAAAILYCVGMVLFPYYFMFLVIQVILCFVAFARMKKTE